MRNGEGAGRWFVSVLTLGVATTFAFGGDRAPAAAPVDANASVIGLESQADAQTTSASVVPGPDIAVCNLVGTTMSFSGQPARVGDIVGMATGTISFNVGTADAIWFADPDNRHPFIAQGLFRLKNDRFEQIGQSWLKHAFFALGETCNDGTGCPCATCGYQPGHSMGDWLGVGCQDTYGASLNGQQSNLGPRYEVNPWNGGFTWAGSFLSQGHPTPNRIERRLQVHDADLNPATNVGATYFIEGYYVSTDDVNHLNSASHRQISISGSPGGTWSFSNLTNTTTGFAFDEWKGTRKTIVAQQIPVVEHVSPDGRCIVAEKTTNLGGGVYHYEYAIHNIDMDRKVSSFSIPIHPAATLTNIDFHAVESHGEPQYSNTPWSVSTANGAITWSTTDNPLRWGTIYNFRFDANAPPIDTTLTLGLFEPGTPTQLTATTTGPQVTNPNCPTTVAAAADGGIHRNRYLSVSPGNAGQQTAVRVRLTSLLDNTAPRGDGTAARSSISDFEGEVRWLGPTSSSPEGGGPTFLASALQCQPFFADWGALGVVHVYGAEIMPESSYTVQNIHQNCSAELLNEGNYSLPLNVATGKWGDVVAPFASGSGAQPNFQDVSAIVAKFQGVPSAPIKARAQLQPNVPNPSAPVAFLDVSMAVSAFQGTLYPFSGPVSCP